MKKEIKELADKYGNLSFAMSVEDAISKAIQEYHDCLTIKAFKEAETDQSVIHAWDWLLKIKTQK